MSLRCNGNGKIDGCSDLSKTKISPFKPTKKQTKTERPKPVVDGGLNQNVRDLGNSPGDVKPSLNINTDTYTTDQINEAKASEKAATKARLSMAKKPKKSIFKRGE